MIAIEKTSGETTVRLEALPMGAQWNVSITGGRAHLGAVALGIPRQSLADPQKTSASVSVLTVTGHKDDEVARMAAHELAKQLGAVTAVCCGIHFDNLSGARLAAVRSLVAEVLEAFVKKVQNSETR